MSFEEFKMEALNDYRLVVASREASLMGRREVLTGKAKFGIFGEETIAGVDRICARGLRRRDDPLTDKITVAGG